MPRHIALLRGSNVGGKNKLPMNLRELLDGLGCTQIATYIHSGNAAFDLSSAAAKVLPEQLSAAIVDGFGLKVPVVLRTAVQWRAIAEAHPFDAEESAWMARSKYRGARPHRVVGCRRCSPWSQAALLICARGLSPAIPDGDDPLTAARGV